SQGVLFEGDIAVPYGGHPSWSPDSERVAFTYGHDIWTTPVPANNQTDVTNDEAWQDFASWSPDNKLIAYGESPAGTEPDATNASQIMTIDVDTRATDNLTN